MPELTKAIAYNGMVSLSLKKSNEPAAYGHPPPDDRVKLGAAARGAWSELGVDLGTPARYHAAINYPQETAIKDNPIIKTISKHRVAAGSILAILVLATSLPFGLFLTNTAGNGSRSVLVELGRGGTLRPLAAELESRGIITSGRFFTLYARLKGSDSKVKAGVYEFNDGMRPGEILGKMLAGEVYQRLFALPEGYSTFQIAEMLDKRGLFAREEFLRTCRDRKLLAELQIDGESAEGYLLPGSYNILPAMTEAQLVREMVLRFREKYDGAGLAARAKRAGLSLRELVTLASMVEKEAVRPEERPVIAAVFANRLKTGMRLQSDPTAVYGVRAFAGTVTKKDILRRSPYNTYLIPALPPGPIGNPSMAAVEAVLNHPQVPYLYFVARGDGSHCFSSTLQEHNQAVYRYLKSGSSFSASTAP